MRPRAIFRKALGRAERWRSRPAESTDGVLSYEITRYGPDLREQVLELQKHLWGPDLSENSAYLSWKYENNPYEGRMLIYLALRDGQVIGMRSAYGTKWQIGESGEDVPAMCMGDTVVAPEYRRRGIFCGLAEFVLRELDGLGYRFAFDLSSGRIVHRGALRMGWQSVGPVEMMRLTRDAPAGRREVDPFRVLDRVDVRGQLRQELRVSLEDTARPGAMAKLVADRGSDGRLRHVRDETFFAWRFRNPLCRYRFLFLETEDADLEGYLVLQTAVRRNRNEVRLVDWEARTPAGRETLLRTVVERLKPAEAAVWSATLPSEVKELLTRAGFEPVHRGAEELRPSILAKLVREDAHETDWKVAGRSLLDLASWDLRMIDSDNF